MNATKKLLIVDSVYCVAKSGFQWKCLLAAIISQTGVASNHALEPEESAMQSDKRIEIVVAVSLPIVVFLGALALCFCLSIVFHHTGFKVSFFLGVAPSLILSISAVFPWLDNVPRRWALSVAGLIPPIVFLVLMLGDSALAGHGPKVLLALSPVIAATVLPLLPLFSCFGHKAIPARKRVVGICFSIVLLIAVLWSAFVLWTITDPNFMGVSC